MSLKTLHIVFIALSALLGLGIGCWGVYVALSEGRLGGLAWGLPAVVTAAVLVAYGIRFLKKLRNVSYL